MIERTITTQDLEAVRQIGQKALETDGLTITQHLNALAASGQGMGTLWHSGVYWPPYDVQFTNWPSMHRDAHLALAEAIEQFIAVKQ